MANTWAYGRVKRRSVKLLDDQRALVQFSTTTRPIGSDVQAPDHQGSTTIRHEDPIGVKLATWKATGEPGDGVSLWDAAQFASGHADDRARGLGSALVVAEAAARKSNKDGAESIEHRFTVLIALDRTQSFAESAFGYLMRERTFALSVVPTQDELPAMPAKVVRRPKKDVAQLRLVEDDDDANTDGLDAATVEADKRQAIEDARVDAVAELIRTAPTHDLLRYLEGDDLDAVRVVLVRAELDRRPPLNNDDALSVSTDEVTRDVVMVREPSMVERASKARRRGKTAAVAE